MLNKKEPERERERGGEAGNRVNECLLPLFSSSPSPSLATDQAGYHSG